MKTYICIDIGGTAIKHGVLGEDGAFLVCGSLPTEAWQGGEGILKKILSIIATYRKTYAPEGVAVSTAGMVDCEKGEIIHAGPQIPHYQGTAIKAIIERETSLPCEVENDVNCAALAEFYCGAARGSESCLCLTIGTGIGGAFVRKGEVYHGFSGSGCEVGYMRQPGGEFQSLASAAALVENVRHRKSGEGEWNGKTIFDAARAGDVDCIKAIDELCEALGLGIANICYVLNPEVVVLGGGIMTETEYLGERLEGAMKRHMVPILAENTRLAFALNRNHAGMLGAYLHFIRAQSRTNPENGTGSDETYAKLKEETEGANGKC